MVLNEVQGTNLLGMGESHHVKWVPRHHGMGRPQVADGEGLQLWRASANILNKPSRTADKGCSSSLGVGRGTNDSSPQNISLLRNVTMTWTDSLDKRPTLRTLVTVAKEISKYKLDLVRGTGGQMGQGWYRTCRRIYIFLWQGA
jgi:hypothetical protein